MILGNLKDHAFSFLAIHDAGTILKTTYKDCRNRQLLARGHTFDFREPSKATAGLKGKRKRTEEVEVLPQIPTHTNPSQTKRIYKQKANKLVSTAPKSQSSMVIANKNHQLQFAPSLPIHPQELIITPEKDDNPVISHQRKKSKRATSTTHSYSLRQTSSRMSDSKSTVGMSMEPPINSSSKGKERQVNKQEGNNSNNITSKLMGTQENINSKRNNNPTSWQTSPGISDSENTNNIPSPLKFSLSNHPNSETQQIASSRSKTQKNFPKGKKWQLLESDGDTDCSSNTRPSKICKKQQSITPQSYNLQSARIGSSNKSLLPSNSSQTSNSSEQSGARCVLQINMPNPEDLHTSNSGRSSNTSNSSKSSGTSHETESSISYPEGSDNAAPSSQASTSKLDKSDGNTILSTKTLEGATIGSTDTIKASRKTRKKVEKSEVKLLRKFDPKILPKELEVVHKCLGAARVPSSKPPCWNPRS
ncbi:hypothetical protein PCASD_06859 [Puccinia coronata f. sp. avenae]|uniref:Uncharacterized protein n=2 Tax=Puccinia coronata f. sp. avenae TaxID=200324 RepID=A0A2N5UYE0_9BASI|nr:hypothetical protein PCASD_06859 [Puccinia coronata f. sp. avenae]